MGPGGSSLPEPVRVAQLPEPLVRRDQSFRITPSPFVWHGWEVVQCHFQDAQQPLSYLEIVLIACFMERDQDLVR